MNGMYPSPCLHICKKGDQIDIVLLGDVRVGKTSLVRALKENKFISEYYPTVGIDSVWAQNSKLNKKIKFMDLSGNDQYFQNLEMYSDKADFIFLVYDVTNRKSFEEIGLFWINFVQEKHIPVLIGTKKDNIKERRVTSQEGEDFARRNNMVFYEVSSKTNDVALNNLKEILFSQYICKLRYHPWKEGKLIKKVFGNNVCTIF